MGVPIIELKDVWKTYHKGEIPIHALRGLSLSIAKGELIAVQGPSGSGKSTAMNLIGCLDVPTKGIVRLDGADISKLPESDLAQIRGRKIGFVFQQFNLISTLSALENVALPMLFQKVPEDERNERAKQLLSSMGLSDRLNHRPNELSGGQQQRVAIARALSNDPDVILADEPTGNLDTKTGTTIMNLLGRLHRDEGKTVILVTHDPDIAKMADRTEFLRDGKIEVK